ncbi:MAG: succinate--CoA ligase subunit alpha [Armatimonadetes bacterium]|nr:succinate--CoA ligase subunit alpha [Armatimonadota bacterium]
MAILVNRETRVVVQGITGKEGEFHTGQMLQYGTKVVAGVTPGKGGTTALGVPVYNTVKEAVAKGGANASVIFVPAPFAADAVLEAVDAGIKVIACITEGIPVHDMLKAVQAARENGVYLIGPNCPGIVTAGETKLGIMPGHIFSQGEVGLISRSGTLTYEVVNDLTLAGLGQTTCVGIGGDPIIGCTFTDILKLFVQDPQTKAVVLIGEIGGTDEQDAARFVRESQLPVVAFFAGRVAPEGKTMGHAGAIVGGKGETVAAKIEAFKQLGIPVADTIYEIKIHLWEVLNKRRAGALR